MHVCVARRFISPAGVAAAHVNLGIFSRRKPMTNPPDSSVSTTTTSTGLSANVAGALSYLLGFITGIVFLVLEKQNRFVRFHAAQSIAVSVAIIVLSIALSILSGVLAF